jgi:hypothetical protein
MKPITPYPPEMTLMKSEPTYYTGTGCISGCNFVSLKMKSAQNITGWTPQPPLPGTPGTPAIPANPPTPYIPAVPPGPPIPVPATPIISTHYNMLLENSGVVHNLQQIYGNNEFYREGLWLYVYR